MKITFLTVGKNGDSQLERLITGYMKRLTHYVKIEMRNVSDVRSGASMTRDRQKKLEGESLLAVLKPSDHVILLDERGKEMTSRQFSEMISKHLVNATRELVFVVGGPFGFSDEVYNRANSLFSLSKMTMTHEMVRLLFVEQLYRAFTIIRGEQYHHD